MGSTLPPVRQLIKGERHVWTVFRRALCRAEQAVVAQRFDCAKRHVQAGVYRSCRWPFQVLAWSEGSEVRVSGETRESPSTGSNTAVRAEVDPRERQVPDSRLSPSVLAPPDLRWSGSQSVPTVVAQSGTPGAGQPGAYASRGSSIPMSCGLIELWIDGQWSSSTLTWGEGAPRGLPYTLDSIVSKRLWAIAMRWPPRSALHVCHGGREG
jgi:hypothetical protein